MSVHLIATVAGTPVAVDELDAAEARLRNGPHAAALPASGTSEGRQLRRWLTQLLVTERVVAAESAARGLTECDAPTEAVLLPDVTARLEIGSVAAAALADPLARALFAEVTAAVRVSDDEVADYHARNPLRFAASRPDPHGWRSPARVGRRWNRCAARSPNICAAPRGVAPSGCGWTRAAPRWSSSPPAMSIPATPANPTTHTGTDRPCLLSAWT